MGFLFPLFLLAGLSLIIPVLIHLFNLRRYKTVFFPHTRFLQNIQLRSRRQSQVRYKWLLALRLLLLAALITAFAQPFLYSKKNTKTTGALQVIYLNNSPGMSLQKGARSLLDIARAAALRQVHAAAPDTHFLLLTNDKPASYEPLPADKTVAFINTVDISPISKTSEQVFASVQSLMQSEAAPAADLYYYSDFRRHAFDAAPEPSLLRGITMHAVSIQAPAPSNIFIDTAFLAAPVLQTGQSNALIVRSRLAGKAPAEAPVLQLSINGQVKSAASPSFNEEGVSTDTLSFSVGDAGWQRIQLYLNDAALRFDDTFRIAARSAPGLSVLVLNEGQANPYIQAAFRSYSGFRLTQESTETAPADWKDFNLVIFNSITHINDRLTKQLGDALQAGQSICIFPARTSNTADLNTALHSAGDIRITGLDTAQQAAGTLQQGSDLVRDLFEKIPANVQLPVAAWHYVIASGLTANGQSVLAFRNGDPLFIRYRPQRGSLYLCATSIDGESGNFQSSYFFVPFLYQMAAQSRSGDVYALTSGTQQPVFLPVQNSDEHNMVHILGPGLDAIPPQRTAGGGLNIFVDAAVQQPGFYWLAAPSGDSAVVALNAARTESVPDFWDMSALRAAFTGKNATWQTPETETSMDTSTAAAFPLWKVCIILALLLLAAETWLLAARSRTQTAATS